MNKPFEEKYAKYYDLFNQGKDYSKECDFLEKVFQKYSPNGVKSILNLGCGTGLHDLELVSRDYNVNGLDLSTEMISFANQRKTDNLEFFVGDMSNFKIDKKFDATTSMFAAFGYLTQNHQIKSALGCIRSHMSSGGLFVFDVWNGLGVLKEPPSQRTKSVDSNGLKITRRSFPQLDALNHVCKVRFDVNVSKDGGVIDNYSENHSMRFFFPQEMRNYLEDANFEVLEICKTFELGSSVNENDWNMVLVSRAK